MDCAWMRSLTWSVTVWASASLVSEDSERKSAAARPTAAATAISPAVSRNAAAWSACVTPRVTASTISFIRYTVSSGTMPCSTARAALSAVQPGAARQTSRTASARCSASLSRGLRGASGTGSLLRRRY